MELQRVATKTLFIALAFFVLSGVFSGCRVGLGIGVEARLGSIYFLSEREDVFGELYLDGERMGGLVPHQYLGEWVFLDFRHQVELHCGYCGNVHTLVVNPPLFAGQVITLNFSHGK
ncbi:MAG: hypothetical protein ACUVQZ_04490 [Candidatus Caldatribacteriaceae bacterium]